MTSSAPDLATVVPIRWPAPRPVSAPTDAALDLEFKPQDRSVHHVRLMALSFVQLVVSDHNYASRVTVTCAELVDAVARKLGVASCGMKLNVSPHTRAARVELFIEADERSLRGVEAAVDAANRGQPMDAYTAALSSSDGENETALGLARIRYEGQMKLRTYRMGKKLFIEASTSQE